MTEFETIVSQHIENISDPAEFEKLVVRALPLIYPEYDNIFHTGVNLEGKTIRCPVDGIGYYLNKSPPELVLLACTTFELKKLETKWLFDRSTVKKPTKYTAPDGDLIKIRNWADEKRTNDYTLNITAIIATNRSLHTETTIDSIITPLYEFGRKFKLNILPLDQGKLSRHLVDSPKGNWILWDFFKISPHQFSLELFQDVCIKSINQYAIEYGLSVNSLKRKISKTVYVNAFNQGYSVQLLSAKSGFGKTTIAYQSLNEYFQLSKNALWLSAKEFEHTKNIEQSIVQLIKKYYPEVKHVEDNIGVIFNPNNPILISIDDISSLNNPSLVLGSIINHIDQMSKNNQNIPFRIIIPTNSHILTLIRPDYLKKEYLHVLEIPSLSDPEGIQLVLINFNESEIKITEEEASQICKKLSNDPYLIYLFCVMNAQGLSNYSESTIIQEYLRYIFVNISNNNPIYSVDQLINCMKCLVQYCIEQKKLEPKVSEILQYFTDNSTNPELINIINSNGQVLKISNGFIYFRHERIFNSLASSLFEDWFQNHSIREEIEIVSDPYFSKYISNALEVIKLEKSDAEWLININPFIFFSFLLNLKTPITEIDVKYMDLVIGWIKLECQREDIPKYVWEVFYRTLMEMNYSPFVKKIIDLVKINLYSMIAGIKHGSVYHGIRFCMVCDHFEPATTNSPRERAIEYALRYHPQVIDDLKKYLTSPEISDENRRGALAFAGHIASSELENSIIICWNNSINKDLLITEAIWAVLNCCNNSPQKTCDDIFNYWSNLSSDLDETRGISDIKYLEMYLRLALSQKRYLTQTMINYLIEIANSNSQLHYSITHSILQYINNPIAIEYVLRQYYEYQSPPRFVTFIDIWEISRGRTNQKLSNESLNVLKRYWEDENQHDTFKTISFSLWLTGISIEMLPTLKQIPRSSKLYQLSCEKRARLNDYSVIPEIIDLLYKSPLVFSILPDVWNPLIYEIVNDMICNHFHDDVFDFYPKESSIFLISDLLPHIPSKDAEKILLNNWDLLGKKREIIHASLMIGTSEVLKLVDKSLEEISNKKEFFDYFSFGYGISMNGRTISLTNNKLSIIQKYLSFFSESELERFADVCTQNGFYVWAEENIKPKVNEENVKKLFPTCEDIVSKIITIEKPFPKYWYLERLFEKNLHELNIRNRILSVLSMIIDQYQTEDNLKLIEIWFSINGKRDDLKIFNEICYSNPINEKFLINLQIMTKYKSLT